MKNTITKQDIDNILKTSSKYRNSRNLNFYSKNVLTFFKNYGIMKITSRYLKYS